MSQAVAAHQRGELETAERDYRAVLAAAPGHADATHFLGSCCTSAARVLPALPLMEQALSLEPAEPSVPQQPGGSAEPAWAGREAERLYREALSLKPDHLDTYINLGSLYAAEGDHPRALAAFGAALKLDPKNYTAWLGRGRIPGQLARAQRIPGGLPERGSRGGPGSGTAAGSSRSSCGKPVSSMKRNGAILGRSHSRRILPRRRTVSATCSPWVATSPGRSGTTAVPWPET